jgi:hypothetical protein
MHMGIAEQQPHVFILLSRLQSLLKPVSNKSRDARVALATSTISTGAM